MDAPVGESGYLKADDTEEDAMERAGENMSKVDTAWLRMDSASNLMMIVGVWTVRPAIRWRELCARVEERLLPYERFRQRVEEHGGSARWVEHEVDVAQHVVREKLPRTRGGAQAALQRRIGELAMQPLDRGRPLWQLHLVENHEGGSAIVFRIHHCIADGIALIGVTLSLVDGGQPPPPERASRADANGAEEWLAESLVRPLAALVLKGLEAAGDRAVRSLHLLQRPSRGVKGPLDLAQGAWQLLGDAAALLLMPDDSPTSLKGKPGGSKRVAWCPPLPLPEVKAIGKALNCSINDVLLSCVAGALGQYLRARGEDVDGVEIRAMVPVNLRPPQQGHTLGNHFGLAPLVLPVGMENPIERVYEVRRRMGALKGSTQPLLAFAVLALAGPAGQAGAGCDHGHVPQQDHRGDDQRAGPARASGLPGLHDRADDVLGAAIGRHRPGRVDPELRRQRAVRRHGRHATVPRPAADHRPLRTGVREAVAGDADAAVGG
jgi:WS/DGAT/MGAT family acyltransferase